MEKVSFTPEFIAAQRELAKPAGLPWHQGNGEEEDFFYGSDMIFGTHEEHKAVVCDTNIGLSEYREKGAYLVAAANNYLAALEEIESLRRTSVNNAWNEIREIRQYVMGADKYVNLLETIASCRGPDLPYDELIHGHDLWKTLCPTHKCGVEYPEPYLDDQPKTCSHCDGKPKWIKIENETDGWVPSYYCPLCDPAHLNAMPLARWNNRPEEDRLRKTLDRERQNAETLARIADEHRAEAEALTAVMSKAVTLLYKSRTSGSALTAEKAALLAEEALGAILYPAAPDGSES